jgi:predicted PurR-regulated permease PerM
LSDLSEQFEPPGRYSVAEEDIPRAGRQTPFLLRAGWGAGLLAGAALLLALWFLRDVVLLGFAGLLLALLLRTPADWLVHRTRLPEGVAVGLVTLAVLGLLAGLFLWRGPAIGDQVRELREQIPAAVEQLDNRLRAHDWGRFLRDNLPEPAELLPDTQGAVARATGVLSGTFTFLTNTVLILFLGLVLALAPSTYVRGAVRLVPPRRRERARDVLHQLAHTLRWWLVGRLISMAVIGVLTGVGLALLDAPLAVVLALIAALLSFIPNIGPVLSALPAVLLGLAERPRLALSVAGLYVGVQFVESYILSPIVDRKTIYLPPALTVLAQLSMAVVAGLLGVALATPLLAVVVVLVRTLYIEDGLGDRHEPGILEARSG